MLKLLKQPQKRETASQAEQSSNAAIFYASNIQEHVLDTIWGISHASQDVRNTFPNISITWATQDLRLEHLQAMAQRLGFSDLKEGELKRLYVPRRDYWLQGRNKVNLPVYTL